MDELLITVRIGNQTFTVGGFTTHDKFPLFYEESIDKMTRSILNRFQIQDVIKQIPHDA